MLLGYTQQPKALTGKSGWFSVNRAPEWLHDNYVILLLSVKTLTSADVSTVLPHHESPGTILVSHHQENISFIHAELGE